jgi:DNA-binding NarL/FixJ family response regulator
LLFTLELAGGHLVTQLGAMLAWIADSSVLGTPFDRLTDREWVVLQGLQSEDGEKQLADRLELSPHTLHSHIKSIYRKLGVQGRLPVLMRLGAAQRAYRMRLAAEKLMPAGAAAGG